jgi:cathepsin X
MALSDRIKLMRKGAFPEIQLAVQVAINCADKEFDGCKGGFPGDVNDFIATKGLPDESCLRCRSQPPLCCGLIERSCCSYVAQSQHCAPENICRNCSASGCAAVPNPKLYHALEYSFVSTVAVVAWTVTLLITAVIVCLVPVQHGRCRHAD